jgi:hypothetical protein
MFFICLLSLIVFPSCGVKDMIQSPTSTPTHAPTLTPTIAPSSTITPTPTENPFANISFINDTGEMVCAIFIYSSDFSGQPTNFLENNVILAGDTVDVQIEKDEYIVEVWDCQMQHLHHLYGFVIEDDLNWNLSEVPQDYAYEAQQLIILVNERSWDICEFFIRPGDSEDWGENHFNPAYDYYLSAGSTLLEEIEPGVYDLKLVYCDGTIASMEENLEIPEGQNMTWTLTP